MQLASVPGNYLSSCSCLFVAWFSFSGFSGFIPQVPIQVLAVTGSASGASVVFHSNVAASLLADGTNLASKLFAKFQTTSSQFQHQGKFKTLLPLLRTGSEWGLEAPILRSRIQRADLLRAMEVKELGNRLRISLPPYPCGSRCRNSQLCFTRCLLVYFCFCLYVLIFHLFACLSQLVHLLPFSIKSGKRNEKVKWRIRNS